MHHKVNKCVISKLFGCMSILETFEYFFLTVFVRFFINFYENTCSFVCLHKIRKLISLRSSHFLRVFPSSPLSLSHSAILLLTIIFKL